MLRLRLSAARQAQHDRVLLNYPERIHTEILWQTGIRRAVSDNLNILF